MVNFEKKFNKEVYNNSEIGTMDINNLVNSTQPPEFILKLLIIQKREEFHTALDNYNKTKALGQTGDISKVRSKLLSLFFQLRATLKNHYKDFDRITEFDALEFDLHNSKDFKRIYNIGCEIEDFLYLKEVIKFDNKKKLDPSDLEGHNKAWGYM